MTIEKEIGRKKSSRRRRMNKGLNDASDRSAAVFRRIHRADSDDRVLKVSLGLPKGIYSLPAAFPEKSVLIIRLQMSSVIASHASIRQISLLSHF